MNFSIFLSRDPDCGKWCVAAWPGPGAGELARKSMEREREREDSHSREREYYRTLKPVPYLLNPQFLQYIL